jgi:hypothetical protein
VCGDLTASHLGWRQISSANRQCTIRQADKSSNVGQCSPICFRVILGLRLQPKARFEAGLPLVPLVPRSLVPLFSVFLVKPAPPNQHPKNPPNKLIPKTIAHTGFSCRTVPVINSIARILVSVAEQSSNAADIAPPRSHLGQKFLDVKRGVSEPFCHEDFRSIHLNRETLLRCRGATGRV